MDEGTLVLNTPKTGVVGQHEYLPLYFADKETVTDLLAKSDLVGRKILGWEFGKEQIFRDTGVTVRPWAQFKLMALR